MRIKSKTRMNIARESTIPANAWSIRRPALAVMTTAAYDLDHEFMSAEQVDTCGYRDRHALPLDSQKLKRHHESSWIPLLLPEA
jgi:hypothetical protein